MEIACANKCGNLTDSPDFDTCKVCRQLEAFSSTLKYKVTWDGDQVEFLQLKPEQAHNLKDTKLVKSVVLIG
jgi:hypothetical protein